MNSLRENPYDPPETSPTPGGPSLLLTVFRAIIATLSGTALVFLVICVGPFAWLLRDGLGPGSTTSSGWNAATRMFWCFYWGPATLSALALLVVATLFRRRGD